MYAMLACLLLAADADTELAMLIAKLGSDSFAERQAASQALVEMGERALPALHAASRRGSKLETRRRIERAILGIECRRQVHCLAGHKGAVFCLAISADCQRIASGGQDGTIRVWDLASGKQLLCINDHRKPVSGVAFSPDGRWVFGGSLDTLWDARTGKEKRWFKSFEDNSETPHNGVFSPDSTELFVGGRSDAILDVRTGKLLGRYYGQNIHHVSLSPDGKYALLSGSKNWIGNRKTLRICELNAIGDCFDTSTFSAQSENALIVDTTGTVFTWQPDRDEQPRRCCQIREQRVFKAVYLEGQPRVLAGDGNGLVAMWDADNGRMLHRYPEHEAAVTCLAVSTDGRLAASGGEDETIRIWRLVPSTIQRRSGTADKMHP